MDWIGAFEQVIEVQGHERARYLLDAIRGASSAARLEPESREKYVNTIGVSEEPPYPGDEEIESRIESLVRWNAVVMVHRANLEGGLGGHIGTFASASTLMEVAFNWHVRGNDPTEQGDSIFFQPHASPGTYARSFLEGRLTEQQLDGFRRELSGGLPSYPHPRSMSGYWEYPTASMGLGLLNAIHQARFDRYLEARGIANTKDRRIWAFVGDGELAEPESTASLRLASREDLNNLIVVVNCNLQQLDGPVRGNGKLIEELGEEFHAAGWTVLKVLWGRELDFALENPGDPDLVEWLTRVSDGELQALIGADLVQRFGTKLAEGLPRGGHDRVKVHAAYQAAVHSSKPAVVLAQTIKGYGLGRTLEARNAIHQVKRLTKEELFDLRERLALDVPDRLLAGEIPPYLHPGDDAPEIEYLKERRATLGGSVPRRRVRYEPVSIKSSGPIDGARRGYGVEAVATTRVVVRLLRGLMKDEMLGPRIVPIVPDEARTFGLDGLFRPHKIYQPGGQTYRPVDADHLLAYVEAPDGQILHEGISEAASMASFHAAGSAYATHGEPMVPFYFFYSMFGFQRTGDLMWSAADQRCRGFLIGATAGGTTLNGEGLQHQDRHSPLLAVTNPAVRTYDPAFAYEVAAIVKHALEVMLAGGPDSDEDAIYYLTVYNQATHHPPQPKDLGDDSILAGLYLVSQCSEGVAQAQILASGVVLHEALAAQEFLAKRGVDVDVWSVPSWIELHRDGLAAESEGRPSWVQRQLGQTAGPFVAVSDWMATIPLLIAPWMPGPMRVLGPSGFGMSDTRARLRSHYNIDSLGIAKILLAEIGGTKRTREIARIAIEIQEIEREAMLADGTPHTIVSSAG